MPLRDHPNPDEPNPVAKPRYAQIIRKNGSPLGVCIFLSQEQLHALRINPGEAPAIRYWVDSNANQLIITQNSTSPQ